MDKKSLLQWQMDAGVDEAVGEEPVNHFSIPSPSEGECQGGGQPSSKPHPLPPPSRGGSNSKPLHHSPSAAAAIARQAADGCETLAKLEAAVRGFDGCAIKKTASKTVFADGNPKCTVMVIGEAPGAQEDVQGIPFCGPSGKLLDAMFATIGLTRPENLYISNTVFWRPPGNRQPTPEETAACLPFVEKHIALIAPKLLVLSGGTATTTLLNKDISISKLRGKTYDYTNPYLASPVPVMVTYHPSYLLRSPGQKRLAWADMLMVKDFLSQNQ
ncbi:MAG: uracil-DNA glycosylase [Pseudomonadota bacterium]|nr:uracil-DNA glycosylase [Pseudomonadota bacterium]